MLGLLAAGVLVAWLRGRSDDDGSATAARGRLRQFRWSLALAVVAASVIATLHGVLPLANKAAWLVLVSLAAALVLALWPAAVRRVLPVALILLGLAGFAVARAYAAHSGLAARLILPQAWLFLLAGGWLVGRSADPVLIRARLALGRVAELPRRALWRALALLPVLIFVAEFVPGQSPTMMSGIVASLLAVVAGLVVLRIWPAAAARLATLGLLILGLIGVFASLGWHWPDGGIEYGAVAVDGPRAVYAGLAEALGVLAIGAWLVPQSFTSARRLLGLPPDPELTQRVQQLTRSRDVAVDTAATDLRRLERDLHDGAQARLVALGMSLRAAERLIPVSPDAAAALVVEARETAARALTELRELVRGVHPPVQADRGLADAIRALALDCPLHVETDIDLPGRVAAPVETACYFAVAEILTNAAKHSGARDAQIAMSHSDGRLRIQVTDFGLGGADPAAGTGLTGVERRLAAFDGILAVNSPAGGPTIVVLEVPCASSSPKISSS